MDDLDHQHRLDVQLGRIAVALERIANALEAAEQGETFDEFMARPKPSVTYVDVPVIDGVATLPNGTTVRSTAQRVQVPFMSYGAESTIKDGSAGT